MDALVRRRRVRRHGIGLALVLALLASPPAGAATRSAEPTANGAEPCSTLNPCALKQAIEGAGAGDTVIVNSGDYTVNATIIATKKITIRGDGARPRIRPADGFNGPTLILGSGAGSAYTLRHLEIQSRAVAVSVFAAPATLGDLLLVGSSTTSASLTSQAPTGEVLVHDSLARSSGGVAVHAGGSSTLTLRNVTAVATGNNSAGLSAIGSCYASPTPPTDCGEPATHPVVDARNTIASGKVADIRATAQSPGTAIVRLAYSNYDTVVSSNASVEDLGGNQSAAPLFTTPVFLFPQNYHQAAGSPTIDSGSPDHVIGPTDYDGQDRVMGSAPDIGADERIPPESGGDPSDPGNPGDPGDPGHPGGDPTPGGDGAPGESTDDGAPPVLEELALAPRRFEAAPSGPSIAARTGTTVFYGISEAATVTFRVQRARRGRRVGGRCVKQTQRNSTRRRCRRWVTLRGSFKHTATQPTNRLTFTGRLRGRRLRPGRHRLVGRPVDLVGNAGARARVAFRIVAGP